MMLRGVLPLMTNLHSKGRSRNLNSRLPSLTCVACFYGLPNALARILTESVTDSEYPTKNFRMIKGLGTRCRSLAKILCRAFFKNVYVSGKQSTEPSTIWTANHTSAIVDPALLMSLTPLPLRPIAKHTLWDHPAMKHLVGLARAIPISRLQDM